MDVLGYPFKIGFFEFSFIDVIDVMVVGFLIYQVYKLLKGSLAYNIFIGLLLVYLLWFIVRLFEMELLSSILDTFVQVGVIAAIIVFQPEIRKVLLFIGRGDALIRTVRWRQYLNMDDDKELDPQQADTIKSVVTALTNLKKSYTGAIMVFTESSSLQFYANTGVILNSAISSKLIESIFEKNAPLHDGAIIVHQNKIVAAGAVLPVSENSELPSRIGMRHKATVGITEHSDAIAFVVSEERGEISYARNGRLIQDISEKEIETLLTKYLENYT